MTNEEKTNKICCKNCTLKSFCKKKGRCDMYKSVLKTAAWKEHQMIEKTVKWMLNNHIHYPNNGIGTEQIIEDFKKEMKEG